MAEWFGHPEGVKASTEGWGEALVSYAGAWLDSWHDLKEYERRQAAKAIVDLAGPSVVDAATNWIWQQKQAVQETRWSRKLTDLAWVRAIVQLAKSQQLVPADVDQRAAKMMADRLRQMGSERFVAMLEQSTRPQLDMIQLNGALFGLIIGGGVGLALQLLEGLQVHLG